MTDEQGSLPVASNERARMFRILRADIGATQDGLAQYLRRSRATINRWERDQTAIPDEVLFELRRIRKTLPAETSELMLWSGVTATQPDLDGRAGAVERIDPTISGDERARLEFVLGELLRVVGDMRADTHADREVIADVLAQLETIHGQLHSPHPSRHVLAATVRILVGLISTAAALATLWELYGDDLRRLISQLQH